MNISKRVSALAQMLIALIVLSGFYSASASAAMVSTSQSVQAEIQSFDRDQLLQALDSAQLQAQLIELGVDPQWAKERAASLTAAEIAEINHQLAEQPAGSSVLSALLVVFILFVITDMLCATDLFTFVHCINK